MLIPIGLDCAAKPPNNKFYFKNKSYRQFLFVQGITSHVWIEFIKSCSAFMTTAIKPHNYFIQR